MSSLCALTDTLTPEQMQSFLHKALESLEHDFAVLDTALQNGQWQEATAQVHRLHSICLMLGNQNLADILHSFKTACNQPSPAVAELRKQLTLHQQACLDAIRQQL